MPKIGNTIRIPPKRDIAPSAIVGNGAGCLDVIVIGRGIMGATAAKALAGAGRQVTVIDAGHDLAGTAPSGGHLKPSWFGNLPKSEYVPAMDLLDKYWGLLNDEFILHPSRIVTVVHRVDTDKVLREPYRAGEVVSIRQGDDSNVLLLKTGEELRCKVLVVCAGQWCQELLPEYFSNGNKIVGKQGVSFRFPGKLDDPFIQPWAPYKQVVAHQQGENEIWIGDGTAVLQENWDAQAYTQRCLSRCRNALDTKALPVKTFHGIRPYTKDYPCTFKELPGLVFVATGAGKLGTIAAGWVANKLLARLS